MASIIWESLVSIGGRSREHFADNRSAHYLFIYIDLSVFFQKMRQVAVLFHQLILQFPYVSRELLCLDLYLLHEGLHEYTARERKKKRPWMDRKV